MIQHNHNLSQKVTLFFFSVDSFFSIIKLVIPSSNPEKKLKREKKVPSTLSYTFKSQTVSILFLHKIIPNQYTEKKLNTQELPFFFHPGVIIVILKKKTV